MKAKEEPKSGMLKTKTREKPGHRKNSSFILLGGSAMKLKDAFNGKLSDRGSSVDSLVS